MAEALKERYGGEIPRTIAAMIAAVHPRFATQRFIADALDGYEALELMDRGRHIAAALRRHLPDDYAHAAAILIESLGQRHTLDVGGGMTSFLFLPHTMFVAAYGLDHFEVSMRAQYELTQRFTAEYSIRPFLERYPEATLERLRLWATDPSQHVRRLVSEGTRPRLPWAPRLRGFQKDPRPVLQLLELLKDDPELYVRRSVANNLNDIGKDHPNILTATARRWLKGASTERRWIVRHALRSVVKAGDANALAALGFGESPAATIENPSIKPKRAAIGGSLQIAFDVVDKRDAVAARAPKPTRILVDFRVHYVKANGKTSPKVFKLKVIELAAGQRVRLQKSISLANMTTRRHYPGRHRVDVILNGGSVALGWFELKEG